MKIIQRDVGKGKTRELIEIAHNQNIYIVCLNKQRAKNIFEMSKELGMNIRFPLSLEEYSGYKMTGVHGVSYLLDDVDDMIYALIRTHLLRENVIAVSTTSSLIEQLFKERFE